MRRQYRIVNRRSGIINIARKDLYRVGQDDEILTAKVFITPDNAFALNSRPLVAIPSMGLNTAISIISAEFRYAFGTTTYLSNDLNVGVNGVPQFTVESDYFNGVRSQATSFNKVDPNPLVSTLEPNEPIVLSSPSNWSDGDGLITVFLTYKLVTIL